jgi:hypothetical protein
MLNLLWGFARLSCGSKRRYYETFVTPSTKRCAEAGKPDLCLALGPPVLPDNSHLEALATAMKIGS